MVSGVPQGSVLGPLLFTLFINDITDNFEPNINTKLFADDVKLYSEFSILSANQDAQNFQNHLNYIQNWASLWQIDISYSKCDILSLGKTM